MRIALFCLLLRILAAESSELERADLLYQERANVIKAKEALTIYQKELLLKPDDKELLWRASMANYFVGHLETDRGIRKKHFKEGLRQAENCINVAAGKMVECFFWHATNLALLKKTEGPFSMAFGLSDIINSYEKARLLNPLYVSAGPYRMLALLYFKAPGFLGGNTKKSYEYIEKAIELSPNEPMNHFCKIRFLVSDNKVDEAIKVAETFKKIHAESKFELYESKKAFNNMMLFLETKKVPKED
jgi:tetratricopeptide (TPR) repeat protein